MTMQYGVDVASTRLDDLDKRVLAAIERMVSARVSPCVLDVGCGQGGLAVALAAAGATVTALDIDDYAETINLRTTNTSIDFIQADIRDWVATNTERFDLVVLQRVLHYLPYKDAQIVLEKLRHVSDKLYLSVTGTTTAIASHYDALTMPITERWGKLDVVGQELFSITAPLCLYAESELGELLKKTGWQIEWLRVSDFGNIKVEAKKRL
jgi:SAM-dependent methyltransferase